RTTTLGRAFPRMTENSLSGPNGFPKRRKVPLEAYVSMARFLNKALALLGFRPGTEKDRLRLTVRERSLGELHPGTILGTLVGSRDANHAAFIARHGLKWFVIHDGKIGTEKYDLPAPFAQIPQDQKEKVVRQLERDGKLEEALAPALGRPVFSPDGARLAYIATRAVAQEAFHWLGVATPVKQFVVADGAEGEKYDRIVQGSLVFSPDS